MSEGESPVSHELRVAAQVRSARSPLIVFVTVASVVFSLVALVSLVVVLAHWLGG